jgi:uncharacterized protein (DUF1697 family)
MASRAAPTAHLALLRGVNVGGRKRVPMEALRQTALDLGLSGALTYLQSGNLAFLAPESEGRRAGEMLHRALSERFGVSAAVIVRPHAALSAVIAANPFAEAARSDPAHLLVVFMDEAPDPGGLAPLRAAARLGEQVEVIGNEVFVHYAGGVADSRLTAALIDRTLRATGTARNWNTVMALEALMRRIAEGG